MRRSVVTATAVFAIALIALSLHSLSTATGGDDDRLLRPLFASSIHPPSTISGTVFDDANGNGEQDAGEPGIPGVTVNLINTVNDTTTTGPNGDYSFTVGWADDYTVTAVGPAGYSATIRESVDVQLTGPSELVVVNFGYRKFIIHLPLVVANHP